MDIGVAGHYRITKNKLGKKEEAVTEFCNLITDRGLTELLKGSSFGYLNGNCVVGVGTAEPLESNLNLTSAHKQAGQVSAVQGPSSPIEDLPSIERTVTFKYIFGPGVITSTVTEIGIKDSNAAINNSTLFSHSLIKDVNGNPTSLTVLPDEYLNVYYSLTYKFPDKGTWVSLTKDIDSVPTTIRMKVINILKTGLSPTSFTEMFGFTYCNLRGYSSNHAILTTDEETFIDPSPSQWILESSYAAQGISATKEVTSENGVFTRRARIKLTPQSGARSLGLMVLQSNNSASPIYLIEASPPINKSIEQEFNLVLDFSLSRA